MKRCIHFDFIVETNFIDNTFMPQKNFICARKRQDLTNSKKLQIAQYFLLSAYLGKYKNYFCLFLRCWNSSACMFLIFPASSKLWTLLFTMKSKIMCKCWQRTWLGFKKNRSSPNWMSSQNQFSVIYWRHMSCAGLGPGGGCF